MTLGSNSEYAIGWGACRHSRDRNLARFGRDHLFAVHPTAHTAGTKSPIMFGTRRDAGSLREVRIRFRSLRC